MDQNIPQFISIGKQKTESKQLLCITDRMNQKHTIPNQTECSEIGSVFHLENQQKNSKNNKIPVGKCKVIALSKFLMLSTSLGGC